ncbi:hypothetical protein BUALT_Bualt07G0121500 [Buddleja alternifolia]|uniref:DRBM domain-containing protein n=1 Tax=Buddleja alternifolia TaxID=168488 RepID=A0AAV6XH45_9LAMI|nr:hypothetical protein BUALT_Bualt07G0121500 [Buddleja alternifolia]
MISDETHEKIVDEGQISGDFKTCFVGSTNKDAANKSSARANLHELCARRNWKRPVFECCNDEGPSHRKLLKTYIYIYYIYRFTFKVVVRMKEESMTMLECFGNPRTNKKAAAEDAAEGALWCLKQMDYQFNKQ